MTIPRLLVLALAAVMLGCAPAPQGGVGQPARNHSVLTYEEMQRANYQNVYDAVAALRSNWVRPQAPVSFSDQSAGQVVVFMEGVLLGDVTYLRQFQVNSVRSIQYLNVSEASARFGLRAKSGPALVVVPATGTM